MLIRHRWPGNVRELGNAVEHAVALARGDAIEPAHPPEDIVKRRVATAGDELRPLAEIERDHLERALEGCGGNQVEAARWLGIARTTLWRMLRGDSTAAAARGQPR